MIAYIGYMMLARKRKNTPANLLQSVFPNMIAHLHSLHSGNIWIHSRNYLVQMKANMPITRHNHAKR